MQLTLYTIPGSHPCRTVEAALAAKDLAYERVDLLPGVAPFHQLARFGRRTVPGLRVDGYKVVGSPLILRTLDGLAADPPLYPRDPAARAAVEEAERWGDAELQEAARWVSIAGITARPDAAQSFLEDANLPRLPLAIAAPLTRAIFGAERRLIGGGRAAAERWGLALPGLLDHADALIADGTLGGEQPNAADLQVAGSVRFLLCFEDLRSAIDRRPCGEHARRFIPRYAGEMPAGALPQGWVSALEAGTAAGVAAAATR